ncbi:MAG: DNA-methyltransferase [Vagococcus fluvialis]
MIDLKQGDCLELMKDIPDGSIDMILCDLPYGTTANNWDLVIPLDKLWEQYTRIIKENGAILLFGQEPFSSYMRLSQHNMYRYDWYWDKKRGSNPMLARKMPMRNIENISVFYKKLPTYNPQMTKGDYIHPKKKFSDKKSDNFFIKGFGNREDYDGTLRYPLQTIAISNRGAEVASGKRVHPTQKPVALLEYLIKTYSNEGETILDNTMGSGSTGVAAINLNRKFIGMELDPEYFEIAKNRIEEAELNKRNKI